MKGLIKGQLVIWAYKENILGIILSAFLFGGVVACSDEQATEKQLTDESGLPEYPIPDRTTIVAFPGAYGAGKYSLSPEYTNLEVYMNNLVNHLFPTKK